jgi:xanthine/uracil permease
VQLRYGIDDLPPFGELLLFGLQWFAIAIPAIVIIGKVVTGLYGGGLPAEIAYLQKLSLVVAVVLFVQILFGHRLPLIVGPSSVLLVGTIASVGFGPGSVHTATMLGGLILSLAAVTGLFGRLQRLFTARVVSVVLLLIGFTLMPTVLGLLAPNGPIPAPLSVSFAFILIILMFVGQRWLPPVWKSTVIFFAMVAGSFAWFVLFPVVRYPSSSVAVLSGLPGGFTTHLTMVPGVLVAFLICFIGLAINDLGSIESVSTILGPPDMSRRVNRGIALTGLANLASGFLGIIGPVNFSLSPGVILSTGCGSRFTLLPAAVLLGLVSFSPLLIGFVGSVPSVVTGSIFVYILTFQIAAGLATISHAEKGLKLESGLVIGLSVLLGTTVSFLPAKALATFPMSLRPIVGNGFVVGVVTALILDHVVYRGKDERNATF